LRSLAELDKLRPKLPCPPAAFDRFRAAVEDRHARFREAVAQLYDAAEAKLWREALAAADAVLAVAPEHREAKAVRGKAWLAASPTDENGRMGEEAKGAAALGSTLPHVAGASPSPLAPFTPSSTGGPLLPKRFLLWVD